MTQKRQKLNADKRKVIADVFQNHWEREDNPMKQAHTKAIEVYNDIRTITKKLVEEILQCIRTANTAKYSTILVDRFRMPFLGFVQLVH